jgi:hypothetical protein
MLERIAKALEKTNEQAGATAKRSEDSETAMRQFREQIVEVMGGLQRQMDAINEARRADSERTHQLIADQERRLQETIGMKPPEKKKGALCSIKPAGDNA